jgi:spore coat protein U-like protein
MRKIIALSACTLAVAVSAPAFAAIDTDTMEVTANVIDNCAVTASPMAFGQLTTLGSANIDSSATVALACTPNAAYDVSMDLGVNASGSQRRLVNGADASQTIPYAIYTDAARTNAWTSAVGNTVAGTASGGVVALTAYGRIPASASAVSAGSYADSVTVTVTF